MKSYTTRDVLVRCARMLSKHRAGICFGVFISLIVTAMNLASGYTLKILVDDILMKHNAKWLWWIQIAFFTLVVVATLLEIYQKRLFYKYSALAQEKLRGDLFRRILNMDYLSIQSANTAEMTTVLNYNVDALEGALSNAIPVSLSSIVSVVGALAVMFYIDWRLTLVSIPVYPLMIIITRTLGRRMYGAQERALSARGSVTHDVNETIACAVNTRVYNLFAYLTDRFGSNAAKLRQSHIHLNVLSIIMNKASWALIMVPYQAILYGIGGTLYFKTGNPSIGTMLIFANLTNFLIQPIMGLVNAGGELSQAKAAFRAIDETLDLPGVNTPSFPLTTSEENCTEIDGLSYMYPERTEPALLNFICDIKRGHSTIIWGPSGSGKSTLLKLIYGLIQPQDTTTIKRNADRWAYLPQFPQLFNLSLRDNFRLANPDISDMRINEILLLAGLDDVISNADEGLDRVLTNSESSLSGGQHRRLCLAVLLASEADILVLDEPTASLDEEISRLIAGVLIKLKATTCRTLIVATHDQILRDVADFEVLL